MYSISDMIQFEIKVGNSDFECGDLYITIYEISNTGDDQVITQSGYLQQCFVKNQQNLPLGDKYSESVSELGNYKVVIEIYDKQYKQTLSHTETFIVK